MFIRHEPCPKCGSRDNLGRYADGGAWCFGCHYREPATHYVPPVGVERKDHELAPEISSDFSSECVAWLAQYDVKLEELIARGVGFSRARNQLVFTFDGGVWQARNFGGGGRSKYFTAGPVNDLVPVYRTGDGSQVLVLVEDCISAIKVGRQFDAMPLLGSHVPLGKLSAISKLYPSVRFWLDADKFKESMAQSERAKLIGLSSDVIFTKLDPKCYDDSTIAKLVVGA